ncbi:MAG: choice-of-anchor Q domain-containing protein [Kofleriaceae bacterium]
MYSLVVALATGCSQPNPVVCCLSPSDCNMLGVMDQSRPCTDGFVCIDHECSAAPPVDAAPACTIDTDCPAGAPHCASSRTCVECLDSSQCDAAQPVCDTGTMACRTCTQDSECGSDVCNVDAGTCTASSLVLYISPAGSTSSTCGQMSPCSFDRAIALADSTRYVIRMSPGTYSASESISGKQVVVDGTGSSLTPPTVNGFAIEATNGATVTVIGLAITALGGTSAIYCEGSNGGTVTLTRATVTSLQSGVVANPSSGNCTVSIDRTVLKTQSSTQPVIVATANSVIHVARSTIDGGTGIQLFTSSAIAGVENTIFRNQGPDGPLTGVGRFTVSFSTFVDAAVKCTSTSVVTIADSILVATGQDAVAGTTCTVNESILLPQSGAVTGSGNHLNLDPLMKDRANGDYSLQSVSPAIDAATASATVPALDYVGTPRPQGPRADLGAFEYKP